MSQYKEVNVTLSASTFSRLEQSNPFNKRRVAEQAIEVIRVAVYTMYPPQTPEEWKETSRFQGFGRYFLLSCYDIVCYLLRKLVGKDDKNERSPDEPVQVTLKIPIGLLRWIEKIAVSNQSTIPEATVYAIEYGHRVLDSQRGSEGVKDVGRLWRDIFHSILKRIVKAVRI
jgi:hypothetical protein